MAKVTKLPPPPGNDPCPDVVAVFKAMLARAEKGEIDGLALVISYGTSPEDGRGTFGTVYVANAQKDGLGFLGSLRLLEHRVMQGIYIPERDD